jgi:hypothetical protein
LLRRALALITLALVLTASTAHAATPDLGGFTGPTAQHGPGHGNLSFKAVSGRSLKRIAFDWQASCTADPTKPYFEGATQITSAVPVKHGSFALTAPYQSDLGDGVTAQISVNASGFFRKPGKAVGDFSVDVKVFDAQSRQIDTCQAGDIAWTATHV